MSLRLFIVAVVTALFASAGLAGASIPSRVQELPLPYHGDAEQVITVVAPNAQSTTAKLTAWQRTPTGWLPEVGPVMAYVGKAGVGQASETTSKTPAGVWTLTEAFGNRPTNGALLPYRQIDTSDWWVSDVKSPYYNAYQRCTPGTCPFNEAAGENLGNAGRAYDRAVVIDYNRSAVVPGAGSAFFLHVSLDRATAGCVSMPADKLDSMLRWLRPGSHPVIDIGIA